MIRVEICVDSVEGVVAADRGGADRVELCANLFEGGTTPSGGTIRLARQQAGLGLQVMIRPRGGDFLYSDLEFAVMREDIRMARELGADGVVFGLLTPDGKVDRDRTAALIEQARPLNVTFHRAFDVCRDPEAALETLVELGVDRVLTSGQEATCLEGLALLAALNRQAAGRITVLAGGGLTPRNVAHIVEATGVTEVHLSARTAVESGMTFRQSRVPMGGALRPLEFSWKTTDPDQVRAVCASLNQTPPAGDPREAG